MTVPPANENPRAFLKRLFEAAVAAAHPATCVPPHVASVTPSGRLIVLGAGKAAAAMAAAVEQNYSGVLEGLVVTADGYGVPCKRIEVVEASHPVPDARGMAAAERILRMAGTGKAGDIVLCLISGGASSLLVLPAPGITLEDKRAITMTLLRSGASINEMNCVRKHLSSIKGGRLAAAAAPAEVVNLIISDVVGDDQAVIASGPTVRDPTTCGEALAIIDRYKVDIPAQVRAALDSGALETPKTAMGPISTKIIARPGRSLAAAAQMAREHGLGVIDLGDRCEGEAREVAREQAALVRSVVAGEGPVRAPCVILSGGELVVTVTGDGRGGPNTEFALSMVMHLDGLANVWGLSADTDGADGNAGAAGAVITPWSLEQARAAGCDAHTALKANDSRSFFAAIGDLVTPGPTFTNVNDFRALLILPSV